MNDPSTISTSNSTPVPKKRYVFIDLYRSAVILLMLEGHVFRAFLSPDVQRSPLFQLHEFIHGLSAPAFLFGAGLTFVISTRKRWNEYHHWDSPLARRVGRFILVILLGLSLHLPYFSFRKIIIEGTFTDYLKLFQFDVLHCIGIGLLSLHALIFFFKKESRFYGLVLSTIVGVCFLTPVIWDIDFYKFLPAPLAQMFNGLRGSPFPMFPYVGFLYTGVLVSWEFLIAVEKKRERQFMYWLTVAGMLAIITGVVFDNLPIHVYRTYNYWFTSPNYFLIRNGSLMVIVAVFWYVSQRVLRPKRIWTVLGIESLFVYVFHLLVIYGSALNPTFNLQVFAGNHCTLWQSVGMIVLVIAAMLGTALLWNYLKRKHFTSYRIVQFAGGMLFLYFFFLRDF